MIKDIIEIDVFVVGVLISLMVSRINKNFIIVCDMLFVKKEFVEYMFGFDGYDVVVFYYNGYFEFFFCVYSKVFLEKVLDFIDKGIFFFFVIL